MQNIAINFISCILIIRIYWHIYFYSICRFCWYNIHNRYNFIARDHWSISNTFQILAILTSTCGRIPTIIFFALLHSHWHVLLFHFWPELLIVLLNLHLHSHGFCIISVCYHIKYFKAGLLPSKKISFYLLQWKLFKNDEKCLSFYLKSSFCSQDI